MKFVSAHQRLEEFVSELENLIQSGDFHANELLVVTIEEHESELESLVQVEIETVSENDFKDNEPLNNHGLDEHSVELYDDMLRRGGYVLLEKENEKEDKSRSEETDKDVEQIAPGFGVDFDEPKSDASNHEDALDSDYPNTTSHR